jgi:O-antigen/teichoic acid export membrane protein
MQHSHAAVAGPNSLRGLARESITFALGGLAYKAVALVSVPIFARLLSPAQLGLLDLAVVIAGVLATIGALGIDNALARRYETDGARAVSTALAVVVTSMILVAVVGIGLSMPLATVLTGDPTNQAVVLAASVYSVFLALVTSLLNVLRVRHQAIRFAVIGFVTVAMEMVFALSAALIFDRSIAAMVLGWAIGSLIGVLLLISTSNLRIQRPALELAVGMIRFGIPFVPAVLAWIAGDLVIRASVAQVLGLGEVGMYGIAARLTSALGILVTGFGLAWHPYLYAQPDELVASVAERTAARLVAGLGAAGAFLAAAAPELIELVAGPPYVDGSRAVPALAAAVLFLSLVTVGSAVAGRIYRTATVAVACVVGVALQVLLTVPMTAAFALAGAAIAAAAGYAAAALVLIGTLPNGRTWGARRGRRVAVVMALSLAGLAVQLGLGHEAALGLRLMVGSVSSTLVLIAGFGLPMAGDR